MSSSLRETWPLRLLIGREDCTYLLSDGATFSNADPGGFESASFSIPRDLPQTLRGQYVRLDCGLGVAWEGRVDQVQRSLGNRTAIQCEGFQALLKRQAASMVFADRDLTRWVQPSYTRQLGLANGNVQLGTTQVAADASSSTPALVQSITDSWASPYTPMAEAWYDAGSGNVIARIYYSYTPGQVGGFWADYMYLSFDANAGIIETTSNLATAGSAAYFNPATPYRFAAVQHGYGSTPGGSSGAIYNIYWHSLAAYGNHGLTGRGSDPVGYYPSDIAGWAASQTPSIQRGVIPLTDASGYIVPHSVYYTPVTLDQMISDMAVAAGWHWGVWESRSPLTGDPRPRFDFRPRPAPGAFTAFMHRSDCSTLDITEEIAQQFNEAVVTFTNVDGTSGAVTVTVDNPILDAAGIVNQTVVFQGGTMDPGTAAVFGLEALALTNVQHRVSGSADVIAAIGNPSGPMPAWMLRAGIDRIRIGDLPSSSAFGSTSDLPISRVECALSPTGWNTSVELGSGADLISTLQARLTSSSTFAQQGGG